MKQSIYVSTQGEGPDVVLVHGYGMHSSVWRDFAEALAKDFRVTCIDLPGHGQSSMIDDFSLKGLSEALLEAAPERAHWLGWSLGALLCLNVASLQPQRVASLCMLSGSACFAQKDDWPCAMPEKLLSQFAGELLSDYQATLSKFLGLQTFGLEDARAVLKELKLRAFECDPPDEEALRQGLDLLRHSDLRPALSSLCMPLLILMGGRDRLVPASAGAAMQALALHAELEVIPAGAHVLFLTHLDQTLKILKDFWRRHEAS